MAVIEFINRKNKTYKSLKRAINYIMRADKTRDDLIFNLLCEKDTAYTDFIQVKKEWKKEMGRQYIHFIQSFSPDEEVTPEIANKIAKRLIEHPLFRGFQIIMATHTDTSHVHTHFIINSVNEKTGLKWQLKGEDLQSIKDYSDELCREYGLNVIDNDKKQKGHRSGGEYRSKENGNSWKYELFLAVTATMKTAVSREDFIKKMKDLGYQVKWEDDKKYITFITPEGKKCRNKKLYPPERFTKENMERVFEQNRKRLSELQRKQKWDFLMNALYVLTTSPDRQCNHNMPMTSLEGEALKEYMLLHENKGEIDWENEETDFEL